MAAGYAPRRGDIVWLSFSPQAGHEQAGSEILEKIRVVLVEGEA